MHILLTDLLSCPRCGPEFGLIVLADEIIERAVVEGRLGCANCREEFPIRQGVADLATDAVGSAPPGAAPDPAEAAYRVAALSGLGQGPGRILVEGAPAAVVAKVAELLPNALVIGASPASASPGVDPLDGWLVHDSERLPLQSSSLQAVSIGSGAGSLPLEEAVRVLSPGGRIILDPATPEEVENLKKGRLELLLHEGPLAVASLSGPR